MTETEAKPDFEHVEPGELHGREFSPGPPSRAHLMFFATMVVLVLAITVTAVNLRGAGSGGGTSGPRCNHVDVNLDVEWGSCGDNWHCDVEGQFTRQCCEPRACCEVSHCCDVPPPHDPRHGLFDAEEEFTRWPVSRC